MIIQPLNTEQCRAALASAGFGRLGCARDNQPYVVPIYFAVDDDYVYSFALAGQKLTWMRDNPQVCVEVDRVTGPSDWTSVVVFGRFEELLDTPEYRPARSRAHLLLQGRPMWWEPGAVASVAHKKGSDFTPVFYRIGMERLSGCRGVPSQADVVDPTHDGTVDAVPSA
jgi:uncharacterized protein